MRAGRIYLPQQDSICTDLARGMLTAHGLPFRDVGRVQFERFPQAGPTAATLGLSEAPVIRKRDRDSLAPAEAGQVVRDVRCRQRHEEPGRAFRPPSYERAGLPLGPLAAVEVAGS